METVQGNRPLFSNRALVGLTIPIILDAVLAIIMGAVDSIMVSSAGEAAVSAVSLVDSINIIFLVFFNSLAIGGSVVTSQYVGSREMDKASLCVRQILYAGVLIAGLVTALLLCFHRQLLTLVYPDLEPVVFHQAKTYFLLTLLGFPFSIIGAAATATLRAIACNKEAVTISMTMNLTNIAGNALLIYGFQMGVAGAAIATTFARVVFATMGLLSLRRKEVPIRCEKLLQIQIDWSIMKRVLRMGVSNGAESSLFQVGKLLVASLVSTFGTVYIAANSVATTLINIGWTITCSFGTVAMTVVGQCIGADQPEQAKMYTKKLMKASTVVMFSLFTLVYLTRNYLVLLFNFAPETQAVSAYYTGAAALLTMGSLYSMAFVPVHAFRAAGDIRYAMVLALSSMFAFRVGLSYLLCLVFHMDLMGVWIGMWADWIFRSILNIIRYRSGKWIHNKLI